MSAYGVRTTGRLAELVADSLAEGTEGPSCYRLGFGHGDDRVEVTVRTGRSGATVTGTGPGEIAELISADGETLARQEGGGRSFALGPVSRGIVRLSFPGSDGHPDIRTDWFGL